MEEIIAKKYAELCKEDPVADHVWYIPHHGVYHPKKKKIRVVFDCGCEYHRVNLNSLLLQGPDLTNKLLGVLCRFGKRTLQLLATLQKCSSILRPREASGLFEIPVVAKRGLF